MVIEIDIEHFFDKVNHSTTLNLIRKYLKACVWEEGLDRRKAVHSEPKEQEWISTMKLYTKLRIQDLAGTEEVESML